MASVSILKGPHEQWFSVPADVDDWIWLWVCFAA